MILGIECMVGEGSIERCEYVGVRWVWRYSDMCQFLLDLVFFVDLFGNK